MPKKILNLAQICPNSQMLWWGRGAAASPPTRLVRLCQLRQEYVRGYGPTKCQSGGGQLPAPCFLICCQVSTQKGQAGPQGCKEMEPRFNPSSQTGYIGATWEICATVPWVQFCHGKWGRICGFCAAWHKKYRISRFCAQCLPINVKSKLGLLKKLHFGQKVGGTKHSLSPGVKRCPPSPTKLCPCAVHYVNSHLIFILHYANNHLICTYYTCAVFTSFFNHVFIACFFVV